MIDSPRGAPFSSNLVQLPGRSRSRCRLSLGLIVRAFWPSKALASSIHAEYGWPPDLHDWHSPTLHPRGYLVNVRSLLVSRCGCLSLESLPLMYSEIRPSQRVYGGKIFPISGIFFYRFVANLSSEIDLSSSVSADPCHCHCPIPHALLSG